MSLLPVVVKLGGDALASPERIATEARRLARLAAVEPTVAVASARRGVTDHLLGLVEGVRAAVGVPSRAHHEADRAVAAGEVVTASLLALALSELGIEAVSLDAREAGVRVAGAPGEARIQAVATKRLQRLLAQGVLPVVTGFQGWHRGRVVTLGRGGTDTSAVALAVALGASRALFIKEADGLRTADPRLVPDSRPIRAARHEFLSAITAAGARVLHAEAARLAQDHRLPLELHGLTGSGATTVITHDVSVEDLRAIATQVSQAEDARVTAVAQSPVEAGVAESLGDCLVQAGVQTDRVELTTHGPGFHVPASQAGLATRVLHEAFVRRRCDSQAPARRAS
jgi:aspartate kinase